MNSTRKLFYRRAQLCIPDKTRLYLEVGHPHRFYVYICMKSLLHGRSAKPHLVIVTEFRSRAVQAVISTLVSENHIASSPQKPWPIKPAPERGLMHTTYFNDSIRNCSTGTHHVGLTICYCSIHNEWTAFDRGHDE